VCAANDSNVKNVRNASNFSNISNFSNVSNISNKSIGRTKKKKGFKGTPSKCNSDKGYDHSFIDRSFVRNIFEEPDKQEPDNIFSKTSSELNVSDKTIDFRMSSLNSIPLGLLNRGENVCFFNSIVQVLHSIPGFLTYVQEHAHSNQYVLKISEMFLEITSSITPVQTSKYVHDLELSNYIFGSQYDAHECLLQILDKIYPSVTDDCLFKISMLESTVCQNNNCQHRAERSTNVIDLELNVISSGAIQTVTDLLSQPQVPSLLEGYRCDGCHAVGSCTKADLITHTSEVLIIQLKIFNYSNEHNMIKKINPNLNIEEEIMLWGNWTLHGIIYHEGDHAHSGHYTCGIKKKDKWFIISDSSVTQKQIKLSYRAQDYSVPYILFYKKVNSRDDNAIELFNIQPAMEEEVKTLYKIPSLNKTISTLQKEHKTSTNYLEFGDLSNSNSEMMNRKSILKELKLQKERILNSNKRKDKCHSKNQSVLNESPIKRKRKYSKVSKTYKMTDFRYNLDDIIKEKLKEDARKGMKELRSNLNDTDKDSLKCSAKKRMKNVRENLDDVSKIKHKDSAKNRMKNMRENLDDVSKIKHKDSAKNRMKNVRENQKNNRKEIFQSVQTCSMTDPSILETPAFKLIQMLEF